MQNIQNLIKLWECQREITTSMKPKLNCFYISIYLLNERFSYQNISFIRIFLSTDYDIMNALLSNGVNTTFQISRFVCRALSCYFYFAAKLIFDRDKLIYSPMRINILHRRVISVKKGLTSFEKFYARNDTTLSSYHGSCSIKQPEILLDWSWLILLSLYVTGSFVCL